MSLSPQVAGLLGRQTYDSNGSPVDTNAGASGSSGSAFTLSRGGLIAIIIIVTTVVICGIVSTVLFVVGKRRQWTMKETLTRASRRLTGRGGSRASPADAIDRRTGMQMSVKPAYRGHKRGLVVQVDAAEKGLAKQDIPRQQKTGSPWGQRLWKK